MLQVGDGVGVTLVVPAAAAPSSSPTPASAPPATPVVIVSTPRTAPPTALPRTGADVLPLVLLAVLLLVLGTALVVAARTRLTPEGNR